MLQSPKEKLSHSNGKNCKFKIFHVTRGIDYMKKIFIVSLCYCGSHGGGIMLTDDAIIFQTGKLILPDNYKKIKILYSNIENINKCRALLIFPSVVITVKDSKSYKFIIFRRHMFLKNVENMRVSI